MMPQDFLKVGDGRRRNLDVAIEPTRTQEGDVYSIWKIRGSNDHNSRTRLRPVKKGQPSIDNCPEPRIVVVIASSRADAIDLVDEQDEWVLLSFLAPLLE